MKQGYKIIVIFVSFIISFWCTGYFLHISNIGYNWWTPPVIFSVISFYILFCFYMLYFFNSPEKPNYPNEKVKDDKNKSSRS